VTAGHLDSVRLAEHAEGLLAQDEAAAVDRHLHACPQCRQTSAALEAVTIQLAAAPRTLPAPPEVVDRLDRALAAEAEARQPAAVQRDPQAVVQLSWFRRRAPQLLAAAATVGLIGFAGYAISTSGQGEDAAMDIATADAPDSGEAAPPVEADDDTAAGPELLQEEAAEDGAADALGADPQAGTGDDDALEREIRGLVSQARIGGAPEVALECGRPLADSLGAELVGTAPTRLTDDGAVLVVVDVGRSTVQGWVLPTCASTEEEALAGPRLVAIE
jgi:anti-sigma factor RsiW